MPYVKQEVLDSVLDYLDGHEFPQGMGRDHSHCYCGACNDGGCGPGTHTHKRGCSWAKLRTGLKDAGKQKAATP